MNIIKFIFAHWDDFLAALVLLAVSFVGIKQWIKIQGPLFMAMSTEEKIAYVTRLITNLIPIALVLVTKAEIKYGGGTGTLKRSDVIDELYKRIPDEYKKYITEENLDSIINAVLPEAEELWADNPKILNKSII